MPKGNAEPAQAASSKQQAASSKQQAVDEIILPPHPEAKITIIGAGIIGLLKAYFAYLDAKAKGQRIRITVYEKNRSISDTTTSHIVPSLTPDEILSVVPRGKALMEKLGLLFSEPGGIRVDDVAGVNDSAVSADFIRAVEQYALQGEADQQARTETLLAFGKISMELWQAIYDEGDEELKMILEASNFNPCREPKQFDPVLHDGYRIDLIYNVPDALARAEAMKRDYAGLGYQNCAILSTEEVETRDPFLADFCRTNSELNEDGIRVWKNNAVALWRPGGCIDANKFLPLFQAYLTKIMGQYVNADGKEKNCFRLKFERNVAGVVYDAPEAAAAENTNTITGLTFFGNPQVKRNKHHYQKSDYVFCPGESVGTLKSLGFNEPEYARFAGASLMLTIPVPPEKWAAYASFNHCMEVHQEGVVLAWQARFIDGQIFIGVAGTKAFYGDQQPHKDQAFAKNRNLLQLNMINDVLPEFLSLALQKDTRGIRLTDDDMTVLEERGIATRWVGSRAVAYDGFPTVGPLFNHIGQVPNASTTTAAGSGGASFGPALANLGCNFFRPEGKAEDVAEKVLNYGSSVRSFR